MKKVLFLQLPIPKLNYGMKTGNIPLGLACLKLSAEKLRDVHIDILPEEVVSYVGDRALIDIIYEYKPDIIGFTLFTQVIFMREI